MEGREEKREKKEEEGEEVFNKEIANGHIPHIKTNYSTCHVTTYRICSLVHSIS